MGTASVSVGDDASLLGLRQAYLQAVEDGAESFTAELSAHVLGLDPGHPSADLSLAPPGAHAPPEIDVVLRGAGLSVLVDLPLQVAARRVTLEGIALVGALRPALRVSAAESIVLRDVTVLGAQADERQRAVVDLAAGQPGTVLSIERCVLAQSSAPDALLGAYIQSEAWFESITLEDTTLSGGGSDAVLAIEAARALSLSRCRAAADRSRVLIRMDWPGERARLSGCALAAPATRLLELRNPAPVQVDPLHLDHGTRTDAALGELPAAVAADDTVETVSSDVLEHEVAAAVTAARERVLQTDGRLAATLR